MPAKSVIVKPVWILVLTAVAQFVLQLDFSIVNVALATIQSHLHFSAVGLQWVVSGYALTFGSLLLIGGRLGDSAAMLIGARLVQGASAALVAPSALAMLTHAYTTPADHANALGISRAAPPPGPPRASSWAAC